MRVQRVRRRARRSLLAQALVEFALLAPALVILALGGITIDSGIQGQSLLQQAVNRAALVGARDAYDPCFVGDAYLASTHGFADVVSAYQQVLQSNPALFPGVSVTSTNPMNVSISGSGVIGTVTMQCTNNNTSPTVDSSNPFGIGSWSTANAGGLCYQGSTPFDKGCFQMWRGGLIQFTSSLTLPLKWSPFYRLLKLKAVGSEAIETFRQHICVASVAAC